MDIINENTRRYIGHYLNVEYMKRAIKLVNDDDLKRRVIVEKYDSRKDYMHPNFLIATHIHDFNEDIRWNEYVR